MSRNGNALKSFQRLADELASELRVGDAVLDGELVCLDQQGCPQFNNLLFIGGKIQATALSMCCGSTVRITVNWRSPKGNSHCPVLSEESRRMLLCSSVDGDGESLFRIVCERDLEGIVAKWKGGLYLPNEKTSWIKVKNPHYSQVIGRDELFERNHDAAVEPWRGCDSALDAIRRKPTGIWNAPVRVLSVNRVQNHAKQSNGAARKP